MVFDDDGNGDGVRDEDAVMMVPLLMVMVVMLVMPMVMVMMAMMDDKLMVIDELVSGFVFCVFILVCCFSDPHVDGVARVQDHHVIVHHVILDQRHHYRHHHYHHNCHHYHHHRHRHHRHQCLLFLPGKNLTLHEPQMHQTKQQAVMM